MIVAQGLSKRFGPLVAVDSVTLTVRAGEVLGFLGPNGAGKTTTMRMIAGFLEPSAGQVSVAGHDVVSEPIAARRALGYLPEGAPLYDDMTAKGLLGFVAAARGYRGGEAVERVERAIDLVSLASVRDRPIETLSKGFKRRVGLAQAILHDPPVLILDEPTDGLDPNQKQHVRALIRGMAAQKAIVVSTHILEEVDAVCTRAVIIDRGRIVADGTAETLLARLPEHNAIVISVEPVDAPAARAALAGYDGMREAVLPNGLSELRLPAGTAPLPEVTRALSTAAVPVRGVSLDPGRLDDVFSLVTRDAGARRSQGAQHG
jgi:ABC-2 type transport system ATP-binding protein